MDIKIVKMDKTDIETAKNYTKIDTIQTDTIQNGHKKRTPKFLDKNDINFWTKRTQIFHKSEAKVMRTAMIK